jgi:hypothetical protein
MGSKYYNDINYQVVKMSYKPHCLGLSYRITEFKQHKKLLLNESDFSEAVYKKLEKEKGAR